MISRRLLSSGLVRYSSARLTHRDVTVLGGNLIGATTAVAIASSAAFKNRRISLVERRDIKFTQDLDKWSNRVYAITPGTQKYLNEIGIWGHLKPNQIHICRRMYVWERMTDVSLDFQAEKDNIVCYNIDQHALLFAIYERLKELDNVELQAKTRVTNINLPSIGRRNFNVTKPITYNYFGNDDITYETDLLIAADGFNSQIRKLMKVQNVSWNYQQKSVIAVLELDGLNDVDGIAFQRFIPQGVVALLPLGNQQACLIWSLTDTFADSVLQMSDEEFVETLNDHLAGNLDYNEGIMSVLHGSRIVMNSIGLKQTTVPIKPPKVVSVVPQTKGSYPLGMGHALNYVVPRCALVGDSAHRVHPLAGQGANFGFSDVECLARNLVEAALRGERIGALQPLLDYEKERQFALLPFQVAIEGLIHLYQTNNLPIVLARSLGVQLLDSLPYVKHKIVQFASR